jgi:hypothetical protein
VFVCAVGRNRYQPHIRSGSNHLFIVPVSDDTIARKVNTSDASAFAEVCGCCPSQGMSPYYSHTIFLTFGLVVWGVIWLIIAFCFFVAGILVGLVAFKVLSQLESTDHVSEIMQQESAAQQAQDSKHFLPVPGANGALSLSGSLLFLCIIITTTAWFTMFIS